MKKKLLALFVAVALIVSAMFVLTACEKVDLGHGDKTITVWVSEKEGVKDLTQKQLSKWLDGHADYRETYTITVEGLTESEAATTMTTDVATGADVYCFAQDQLARLVEAQALAELTTEQKKFVEDNNDAGSVKAAVVNNKTFAYPITSDNGYFMYYDKSVVKADSIDDLAKIVKDCEDSNKKFSFELGGSAWYTASFFFATGCTSTWTFNDETNKWKAADDFNSANGLIALKGMQILTKSDAWEDSSKAADFGAAVPSAVVVTGTWDSDVAKENLGDNYAVAKLPKFTVDGKSYQLGSFTGYKLMGVKPSSDTAKLAICHEIAQLLSGADAQEARYDSFGWGPSNKTVQNTDKVKKDPALMALAAQNAYGTPQGNINGGWWDFAKLLGSKSKDAADDAALQALLKDYDASIAKYEKMSVEAVQAWGIVGSIASLAGVKTNLHEGQEVWADWGTDVAMDVSDGADGAKVYKTKVAIALTTKDEFKFRQGQGWDTNYGGNDETATLTAGTAITANAGGPNLKVAADGTYYIVLTIAKDGKTATVSLEAAQ